MERRLVLLLGGGAGRALVALRRAFRAVVLVGAVTAILVAAATEAIAFFLTGGRFPPTGATHLAAAALAIALGYAAAITVAIVEILRAIVEAIDLLVAESEKLAPAAVREAERLGRAAEREAERLGHGVLGGPADPLAIRMQSQIRRQILDTVGDSPPGG